MISMLREGSESRTALIGSVGIHVLLFLLLMMIPVQQAVREALFVEVTFGGGEIQSPASSVSPASASDASRPRVESGVRLKPRPLTLSAAPRVAVPVRPRAVGQPTQPQRVFPPLRSLTIPEDRLPVTDAGKLSPGTGQVSGVGRGRADGTTAPLSTQGTGVGKEAARFSGVGNVEAPSAGGGGKGEPGGVGYSVSWAGGGTRLAVSTPLPTYPEGVNREGQVQIRAAVGPDGSVRRVDPVRKIDARLEEAALTKVRLWRFEPLAPSLPQVDQSCVITFEFRLR
ncbi:MAG: hypothetical protein COS95_06500 [Ignavibacteriales bacterium CG07_land_8_20_14_0_80_59_12]|nr:MAG: hypothetical protein COS95_06500 [Ignavibacteriales bacterium CG07_land_8_20_14_0_80_59_12]